MSLSAGHRANLYDVLTAIGADKTAVSEMLAHFPTNDDDRPVTGHQLTAEMATLRAETAAFRANVDTKFAHVDTKLAHVDTKLADVSRQTFIEIRLWFGLAIVILGLLEIFT